MTTIPTTTPAAIPAVFGPPDFCSFSGESGEVATGAAEAVTTTVLPGATLVTTEGVACVVVAGTDGVDAVGVVDVVAALDDEEAA